MDDQTLALLLDPDRVRASHTDYQRAQLALLVEIRDLLRGLQPAEAPAPKPPRRRKAKAA